jgi:hypothetical protein
MRYIIYNNHIIIIIILYFKPDKRALSLFRNELFHQDKLNPKPMLHFSGSTVIDTNQLFPNKQLVYQTPEPLFGKHVTQPLFLSNKIGTEKPKSVPGSYNVQQFPSLSGSQNLPSKHINNHSDKEEVPEKIRAAAFPSTSITHSTGSSENQTFINSEKFKIQSTPEKQIQKSSNDTNQDTHPQGNKRVHQTEISLEKDEGFTKTHSINSATFQIEELGSSYYQCDTSIVLNPSEANPQLS